MNGISPEDWSKFDAIPNRDVFAVIEYEQGRKAAEELAAKVYRQKKKGDVLPDDTTFVWPKW